MMNGLDSPASSASIGKWSEIDWSKDFYSACDPYFIWMDIANRLSTEQKYLPILLEMEKDKAVSDLSVDNKSNASDLYRLRPTKGDLPFRYGTAYANKNFFKSPAAFGVDRFVLGVPRIPIKNPVYVTPVTVEKKEKPIVVIVDDGMPFLNQAFLKKGLISTRVLEFQNLEEPKKYFSKAEINNNLNSAERLTYQILGYDRVLYGSSHGAHVMDTAVGSGKGDSADDAEVIAVQLPVTTLTDSSGGGLAVHALDALVDTFFKVPLKKPIIACLSYGIHAGPHDGSSVLERAFDELLASRKESYLVLPVGNNRQAKGHACFTLSNQPHELKWNILPQDQTDSFCEIWSQPVLEGSAQLIVQLIDPNGHSIFVDQPQGIVIDTDRELPHAAVILRQISHHKKSSDEDSQNNSFRWQALLCVRATQGDSPAAHGQWTIRTTLKQASPEANLQFDAWIERDGAVFGADSGGQQSFFEESLSSGVTDQGTINGIATGQKVIVVSAKVGNNSANQVDADYSAQTSDSVKVANLQSVFVDETFSGEGLYANGPISGERMRLSGSSVAAALYTRQLYNELVKQNDQSI
jgi:hypothetical protein